MNQKRHTPVTPALGKLKHEDLKFKMSLAGYRAKLSQKTNKQRANQSNEQQQKTTTTTRAEDVAQSLQHPSNTHKAGSGFNSTL